MASLTKVRDVVRKSESGIKQNTPIFIAESHGDTGEPRISRENNVLKHLVLLVSQSIETQICLGLT